MKMNKEKMTRAIYVAVVPAIISAIFLFCLTGYFSSKEKSLNHRFSNIEEKVDKSKKDILERFDAVKEDIGKLNELSTATRLCVIDMMTSHGYSSTEYKPLIALTAPKQHNEYVRWIADNTHRLQQAQTTMTKHSRKTIEHVVKSNETLSIICEKYNADIKDVTRLNDIKNPDQIRIGQSLKIELPILTSEEDKQSPFTPVPHNHNATP